MLACALALAMLLGCVPAGAAGAAAAAGSTKLIAFTFDDGPSPYTAGLLDGLRARGASATFFMTGVNGSSGIVNQGAVLTRMRDEGHQLANHTYSHIVPFNTQSAATISSQVGQVEQLLFPLYGRQLYRHGAHARRCAGHDRAEHGRRADHRLERGHARLEIPQRGHGVSKHPVRRAGRRDRAAARPVSDQHHRRAARNRHAQKPGL